MNPHQIDITQHAPLTQIQRIIVHMLYHPEKSWWIAQDFMPPAIEKSHPHHVGYEATARMSDLLNRYGQEDKVAVFEVTKLNKFRAVRVKWENFEQSLKDYPDLIPLAERTDILKRFAGLIERVEDYKLPEKAKPAKFASYA